MKVQQKSTPAGRLLEIMMTMIIVIIMIKLTNYHTSRRPVNFVENLQEEEYTIPANKTKGNGKKQK